MIHKCEILSYDSLQKGFMIINGLLCEVMIRS